MAKVENGRIADEVQSGTTADGDEVVVGNEQYAGEAGTGKEPNKGPDEEQWPVENRDLRLKVNKGEDDPDYVGPKGPDPSVWSE